MRAPDFWYGSSPGAKLCATLLSPLSHIYAASVRARAAQTGYRARARVLCIGNVTAGGTGKTPVALALAHLLRARGANCVFLSRGYGGRLNGPLLVDAQQHSAEDVGDEPLLLAAAGPAIISADRAAGARLADTLGADVILMDDGFQNFTLKKDVSLLVVDAAAGFGNGRVIPAGPLREPVAAALARADGVILMGDGVPALPGFEGPALRAHLVPTAPDALRGATVFAFAGIGRPEKFFASLRAMGATLAGATGFPDHHRYGAVELSALRAAAKAAGARLITTEKDYVRLPPESRLGIAPVPVHAAFTDEAKLAALLDTLIPPREQAL